MFAVIVAFNPLYVAGGVLLVFLLLGLAFLTVTSGLGLGHFSANKKKEEIQRRESYYEIARMAHNAEAPHFEKFFRADATGSLIGKLHAEHDLLEIAKNPALVRKLAINSAEHLLAYEAATPEGRKEVERDLRKLIDQHHGDAVGTFAGQVLKLLSGTQDTTTMPQVGATGTVTVPTHIIERHYYGAPDSPKPEVKKEDKPVAAAPAPPAPVTVNVHPPVPAPATGAAPTTGTPAVEPAKAA